MSPKIELIHCSFRIAEALGKKLYMSEKDYKKFYKSCENVGFTNSAGYTPGLVIHDYKEAARMQSLHIDYNSVYGGYRLDQFVNKHGAIKAVFTDTRYNAKIFTAIMRAYLSGVLQWN